MAKKQKETSAEDEVIDATEIQMSEVAPNDEMLESFNKYKTPVLYGLGALVVVVGLWLAYTRVYVPGQEENAQKQAVAAFRDFARDSLDRAMKGAAPNPGLPTLADEFGGTKTGNLARYMAGVGYLNQNKIDDGVKHLESFDKDQNLVSATAIAALAYSLEEKNQFEEAAAQYRKAAELVVNKSTSPDFLADAARCYEQANKKEEALAVYKEIKRKFPTSEFGKNVDKYIAKLSE